jgi:hypothetical protein
MDDIWNYYKATEAFVKKEFCIAIILILAAIVSETVLKDD